MVDDNYEHDTVSDVSTCDPLSFVDHDLLEQQAADDSHTERNNDRVHMSSAGYPIRQMYLQKLGLSRSDADVLRKMHVGTLIHEYISEVLADIDDDAITTERDVSFSKTGTYTGEDHPVWEQPDEVRFTKEVVWTGRYDMYNERTDVVTDIKTRGGWYNFNAPVTRHCDQLQLYMHAVGAEYGRIVYLDRGSLRRAINDGRPDIEDEVVIEHDPDRVQQLTDKAARVVRACNEGVPETKADIPFPKTDAWLDQSETLPSSLTE